MKFKIASAVPYLKCSFIKEKILLALRWSLHPEHRFASLLISGQILLLILAFTVQSRGVILPVGKEVVTAYKMLQSTPSGRRLINEVRNVTKGRVIYLTLGNSEYDELFDENGRQVRGLTRSNFHVSGTSCNIHRITVIANKDIVGENPQEIVKSLAFELENVHQIFSLSCACPWQDSPRAPLTQARVIRELGLD